MSPAHRSRCSKGQVELAEARGVGEQADLDDLLAPDREADDRNWLSPGAVTIPAARQICNTIRPHQALADRGPRRVPRRY